MQVCGSGIPLHLNLFIFIPPNHPGFAKKRHIWTDYAAKGFWTMMGDDWATTMWAFDSTGHPLDYRYKIVANARVRKFNAMKRCVGLK